MLVQGIARRKKKLLARMFGRTAGISGFRSPASTSSISAHQIFEKLWLSHTEVYETKGLKVKQWLIGLI